MIVVLSLLCLHFCYTFTTIKAVLWIWFLMNQIHYEITKIWLDVLLTTPSSNDVKICRLGVQRSVFVASFIINIVDRVSLGIPVSQQSLVWRSIELDNDFYLREYNIQNGATLRLVLAMRGGPVNTRRGLY